jgi:hypothetical protein
MELLHHDSTDNEANETVDRAIVMSQINSLFDDCIHNNRHKKLEYLYQWYVPGGRADCNDLENIYYGCTYSNGWSASGGDKKTINTDRIQTMYVVLKYSPLPIRKTYGVIVDGLRSEVMAMHPTLWNHVLSNIDVPPGHWLESIRNLPAQLTSALCEYVPRELALMITCMC